MPSAKGACLPHTWFMAVYLQLSLLLPVLLYFFLHYPFYSKLLHILGCISSLVWKYIVINVTYEDMASAGISTVGMTNPARNVHLFARLYSMPYDNYLTFVAIGAFSGLIFFDYVSHKVDQTGDYAVIFGEPIFGYLTTWKKNTRARTVLLLIVIGIVAESFLTKWSSSTTEWPKAVLILHAVF